jgi:hypothetical protein
VAAKLNVWRAIEILLGKSHQVYSLVASGELQLHGAYFDVESGHVAMLGEHPSKSLILSGSAPATTRVRTAADPPVPAEEALATMFAGNRRYVRHSLEAKHCVASLRYIAEPAASHRCTAMRGVSLQVRARQGRHAQDARQQDEHAAAVRATLEPRP